MDLIFDSTTIIQEFKSNENNSSELFRSFHTLKARFGQFRLKSLTTLINDIEESISNGVSEEIKSSIETFNLKLNEFLKKNRLIVEAANKFLVDEGEAIQLSELIGKRNNFSNLDDLFDHIKNEYLLSDIKIKFERYISIIDELAEKQGKQVKLEITGDQVLVDTNVYSNFINTSIHLFRNMVDHGIETEEE